MLTDTLLKLSRLRLGMSPADPKEKKRKRSSRSPVPTPRSSFRMAAKQEVAVETAQEAFDRGLQSSKDLSTQYAVDRRKLLQAESETSWDRPAKETADNSEVMAGAIIKCIREYERANTFGNLPGEALPGPETLDMGGQFLTNKSRIEQQSKLFEIAKLVPKGTILHLHFNAELHPKRLLEEARKMKTMCIRSTQPIVTDKDLQETEMVFGVKPENTKFVSVFSAQYLGKGANWKDAKIEPLIWMRWSDFRREFKRHYGDTYTTTKSNIINTETLPNSSVINTETLPNSSEQGPVDLEPAENWLLQKMVLGEEEAYSPNQTVNGVWARFNQATRCFKGLLNYEKVYKWYISNAIDHLIAEKVMYAELRPMLLDKSIPTDDGYGKLTNSDQMRLLAEGVKEKQRELEKVGHGDLFPFGLKIIYCTPRSIPKTLMQREMKDCIELKMQYPDLVCGFDLVGAEDRPNNIGYYYEELVAFKKTCADKGLEIPFLFHAGETLLDTGGTTDPTKSNIYDACLLKSKRIGHGYSLLKHPHLLPHFRKTDEQPGICIELCPISNELLHLCRNIKEHPFPQLLAQGIPCTVNSDNPSLFSNSMSHEFYQIMVGAPSITIHSWKQLALWSLEYSCLSEPEKERGKTIFLKSWKEFCEFIVAEYGKLGNFGEGEEEYDFTIDTEKANEAYRASKNSVRKS